jgi:hypothetical protein
VPGGARPGVLGARRPRANAANLPLRLIRRTGLRKGPAAFSFPPEPNRASPSSAVVGIVLLTINDLRLKLALFLHYILHKSAAPGQSEAQMGEQEGDVGVGFGDGAQA